MGEALKRDEWRERVAGFERSGQRADAWCARHGVSLKSLLRWRRALADSVLTPTPTQTLVPILVAARQPVAPNVGEVRIEIGGMLLFAGAQVDAAWLAALLRGLR
jgi:hypothetical protein